MVLAFSPFLHFCEGGSARRRDRASREFHLLTRFFEIEDNKDKALDDSSFMNKSPLSKNKKRNHISLENLR